MKYKFTLISVEEVNRIASETYKQNIGSIFYELAKITAMTNNGDSNEKTRYHELLKNATETLFALNEIEISNKTITMQLSYFNVIRNIFSRLSSTHNKNDEYMIHYNEISESLKQICAIQSLFIMHEILLKQKMSYEEACEIFSDSGIESPSVLFGIRDIRDVA